MNDIQEILIQKFVALLGFCKLARDRAFLSNYDKALKCLNQAEKSLKECKDVIQGIKDEQS